MWKQVIIILSNTICILPDVYTTTQSGLLYAAALMLPDFLFLSERIIKERDDDIMKYGFSEITPEIKALAERSMEGYKIDPTLYTQYDVKRGLRDINGNGVVAGLTNISTIKVLDTGEGMPNHGDGKLYYRGIDVEDIVAGFIKEKRFGFEETVYLLLFGTMPSAHELAEFRKILADFRKLPSSFNRDVIMKAPSDNMMNTLAKSVLALYSYDENANDISIPNVLRQCIELITLFPVLAVYGYQAYRYSTFGGSLFIHDPDPELSISENLLYMLRPNKNYTELEARILDLALVLHAEHGGGTNLLTWLAGGKSYFVIVKCLVALAVAFGFNYPLQRGWVFRQKTMVKDN